MNHERPATRRLLAGSAGVLVALVVFVLLILRHTDRDHLADAPLDSHVQSAIEIDLLEPASDGGVGTDSETNRAPAVQFPDRPLRSTIHGRVLDERGRAIPAAQVALLGLRINSIRTLAAASETNSITSRLEAATDGNGYFEIADVPAYGNAYLLTVRARPMPVFERYEAWINQPSHDCGDIVVGDGCTVSGHVVDEAGSAIGQASILWMKNDPNNIPKLSPGELLGESKPNGTFTVRGLPSGSMRLAADADHLRSEWTIPFDVSSTTTGSTIDIVVKPCMLIRGRVVDRSTTLGVQSTISFAPESSNRLFVAQGDPDGAFSAWAAFPEMRLTFAARAPGYLGNQGVNTIDIPSLRESLPDLTINIEPKPLIDFVVRDAATKAPIQGAELVWATDLGDNAAQLRTPLLTATCPAAAFADANGRIRAAYPRGVIRCVVRAQRFAPRLTSIGEITGGERIVTLGQGGTARVRVTKSGAPVAGARVELQVAQTPLSRFRPELGMPDSLQPVLALATADDEGNAAFINLPPCSYSVRVRGSTLASEARDVRIESGQTEVATLEVFDACMISGTVSRDGRPTPAVVVEARRDPKRVDGAVTDSHGFYAFDALAPGNYKLVSLVPANSMSGYVSRETSVQEVTLAPGEHQVVNLAEAHLVTVKGSVQVNDKPRSGLLVEFQFAGDPSHSGRRPEMRCSTNALGQYTFEAPMGAVGDLSVTDVSNRSMIRLATKQNISPTAATTTQDFEIEAGSLDLQAVRKTNGTPMHDHVLRLAPNKAEGGVPQCDCGWMCHTRGDGRCVLPSLPVGSYKVKWVGGPNGMDDVGEFRVTRETASNVRIEIGAE